MLIRLSIRGRGTSLGTIGMYASVLGQAEKHSSKSLYGQTLSIEILRALDH